MNHFQFPEQVQESSNARDQRGQRWEIVLAKDHKNIGRTIEET